MASQQPAPAAGSSPSAQVVGHAFVQQYYHILDQSPELVHRFYQETSKLGRPDANGMMTSVTTTEAINEKILSMDFFGAEIKTVDAQESLSGGVIVLVTGYITGKDAVKRDFTQSFFLAPQDKGYFVLNDMFRYVGAAELPQVNQELANGMGAPLAPEQAAVSAQQPEQHVQEEVVAPPEEEEEGDGEEVYNPPDNGDGSVVEEEALVGEVIDEVPYSSQPVAAESSATSVQEEAPKKSYASIVKVMKDNAAPMAVPTPTPARPAPAKPERQAAPPSTPAPTDIPAASTNATESTNAQEAEADGYSIYVKSLPLNATPAQLEEEFKRFGPIKPDGIQVRSHKLQGFCFGFVEFEVASAVQSAIEASPILIGGRPAYVEEKRTTGSRVNNRGRFPPGRGGFRSDGMRGRGNYSGGRGYGRGDFNARPDFSGRGGGRGGSGYQRVDHVGSNGVRGGRAGASAANASPK